MSQRTDTPHGESLKIAKELIKSYAEEATAPLSLRRGNTDELKLARAVIEYATALHEATGIGIASYAAYVGSYESLNAHKRAQWDRLNALAAMSDGLEGQVSEKHAPMRSESGESFLGENDYRAALMAFTGLRTDAPGFVRAFSLAVAEADEILDGKHPSAEREKDKP